MYDCISVPMCDSSVPVGVAYRAAVRSTGRHCSWVLCPLLLLLTTASFAQSPDSKGSPKGADLSSIAPRAKEDAPKPPATLSETLKNGFAPVFRITSTSEYVFEDREIVDSPVKARRFIYSGHPFQQEEKKGKKPAGKTEYRIEYADVVLVPVESSFHLNHALVYAQPERRKETADYFFSQYGIQWRNLNNGLKHFTVYAGRTIHYYVFASANVMFLIDLKEKLHLMDGFVPEELLAECLSIHDFNNISAFAATSILPKYGNSTLPLLQESIQKMVELNEGAYPQFRVLLAVDTKESVAMMNEYAENATERNEILLPLFDAIVSARKIDLKYMPCYRAMLRDRVGIPFAAVAMQELKQTDELKRSLIAIRENPDNYEIYKEVVAFMYAMESPDRKTIHESAEKQVRMLLVRNGEVPDTMPVYDIFNTKTASEREAKLDKEDMQRVAPILADMLDTPDRDLTMLAGLNLAFTEYDDPRVSPKYIARVRSFGVAMLKNMPDKKPELTTLFRSLYKNARTKKNRALVYDTAHQLGIIL